MIPSESPEGEVAKGVSTTFKWKQLPDVRALKYVVLIMIIITVRALDDDSTSRLSRRLLEDDDAFSSKRTKVSDVKCELDNAGSESRDIMFSSRDDSEGKRTDS